MSAHSAVLRLVGRCCSSLHAVLVLSEKAAQSELLGAKLVVVLQRSAEHRVSFACRHAGFAGKTPAVQGCQCARASYLHCRAAEREMRCGSEGN